jgi:hypothetical protein
MSNYLSQPTKYAAPPSDNTFELLAKVALAQQQKYDINHQKIQETLDAFGVMRTLRPEDDAYIAAKLNNITTQIESTGGNLANQSLTDSLIGNVKAAAKDPFIINAIEQTKKKQAVDAQYAEYAKKDPSLANQKNYNDMLDLGGYQQYMAGKADKLGTLTYNPYVDINTTLNKKAAEYSKERGLKDEYLGTTTGQFETVDKYGNKVTEAEIQKYLYSNLSGSERTQMQIDARADYKYMPQTDFDRLLLSDTEQQNVILGTSLAEAKARVASASESEKYLYTNLIAETQRKITENNDKIKLGSFDKSEMYNYHAKNVVNSIAANYDIDRITKIDRDKLPFEVMKWETETELKREELAQKDLKNKQANIGGLGTATTIPTITEEQEDTGFQVVRKNIRNSDVALDTYLKANNPDYAKMTPNEQWNYKINLQFSKPTIEGANTTFKTLVDNFKVAQSNYAKIINDAKPKLAKTVMDNYNNLISGRDLNLKNLATSMPLTAGLLQNKRPFSTLTQEEQLGVVTEFAANNLQYNNNLKGDVRKVYERVVDSNKATLDKLNTPTAKAIKQAISNSSQKEEIGGYWSNLGNRFSGAANVVLGVPLHMIGKGAVYGWNSLFNGDDVANREYNEWDKSEQDMLRYRDQTVKNYEKFSRDYFGGEDTNLTELEERDLKKNSSRLSVGENFNNFNNELKNSIDNTTKSFLENQKETQAFTFSTADKEQKSVALSLRGALLANGETVPNTTQDFSVSRNGSGFNISFLNKKGDAIETKYVSKLPNNVVGMIDTSTQNWNNSAYNPNVELNKEIIKPYQEPVTRDKEIKAVLENMNFPTNIRISILNNPGNSIFATIPELEDKVKEKYSNDFYNKNKQSIDAILNTNYEATPYTEGGAFYAKITYSDNGKIKTQYIPSSLGAEKNDYQFYLQYSEAIARIRDNRIDNLSKL